MGRVFRDRALTLGEILVRDLKDEGHQVARNDPMITAIVGFVRSSAKGAAPIRIGVVEGRVSITVTNADGPISAQFKIQPRQSAPERPTGRTSHEKWSLLRPLALLLPSCERADWQAEQRAYLHDLPTRWSKWRWVASQFLAMPRYAYTVRTGTEKESA